VLVDLQGPKIRIGRSQHGPIELAAARPSPSMPTARWTPAIRPASAAPCRAWSTTSCPATTLLLDDGAIELMVEEINGRRIDCKVVVGGKLSNNKGINKKGGGLSAPALTDKDKADIVFAAEVEADYLAVSFVCNGDDVRLARELFVEAGGKGGIVAKIERAEACWSSTDIIDASDASWSPAATSASRSATPSCRRCRSA
jgi:pyruvate kinase